MSPCTMGRLVSDHGDRARQAHNEPEHPRDRGPNLRGITDAQRVTQLVHELVKPRRIAGALDPDCHRSAQAAVELLHLVATMLEPTLSHLAGLSVSSTATL
jgi:hypothetical protein